MKFSNPNIFYLIWLVAILIAVSVYGIRKRARVVSRFIAKPLIPTMIPTYSLKRQKLKALLLILVLFLLVLSMSGPLAGFRWEEVKQKGVDIIIALDCSKSMLATDIKPSRLEQAKREIIDLLNMMHSDRAGLVAFAGTSILQCPLTLDYSGFSIFLNALNPDYLPMGGTDISGAIQTAINGFENGSDTEKAIIIITDGEDTVGDPVLVAAEAAKSKIKIFCIGVGQKDGAPIPDTSSGGFKKDESGKIVISKVDDEILQKISAAGGGLYVRSVAGDMDLDQIYTNEIQKNMEKKELQSGKKKVWENRFQWILLPAALLLIFELLISERKKESAIFSL
ncbi:MAG: VWA domain-containing protein [Desulfamplus sp.]|nr:VWA domain-containing protein [Desulfamplus sp.]MBF0240848.1 VWA domain-containing protein [Desulfamplus sp.]